MASMTDRPAMSEAVRHLMAMTDETVSAKYIAPIVKMSESVIVKYAKDGTWNLCRYVVSGNRVKFFRRDFLEKCGFVDPEPEEDTIHKMVHETTLLIAEMTEHVKIIERMMACMMTQHQRDVFQVAIAKEIERETATSGN